MIDLIVALCLASAVSVWRFYDGSDKSSVRSRSVFHWLFVQSSTPACLCLIAVAWAVYPEIWQHRQILHGSTIFACGGLVFYLLIRGMPGWTHFLPHSNPNTGKKHSGMLIGYALPMFLCGALGLLVGLSPIGSVLTALVGVVPCLVYVLGSRLEEQGRWSLRLTAEELGRLSMGCLVFPLPLL